MKKAFTLPEAIICVGIVAVVAAIMIPGLTKVRPDEEKMMLKKAYHTTSEIISYLTNDVGVFSRMQAEGFADNKEYIDLDDISYSGSNKFCALFRSKVNLKSDGSLSDRASSGYNCSTSFTSIDGINWRVTTNPANNIQNDIINRVDQADYIAVSVQAPKRTSDTWYVMNVSRYGRISLPSTKAGSSFADILTDDKFTRD